MRHLLDLIIRILGAVRLADNPALELLALLILPALGKAEVELRSALAFAEWVPFLSREIAAKQDSSKIKGI